MPLLDAWLQLGERNLLLTGDQIVWDLHEGDNTTIQFALTWVGAVTAGPDFLFDVIDGQMAPVVQPLNGEPVFQDLAAWRVDLCRQYSTYAEKIQPLLVTGTGQRLAAFAGPGGLGSLSLRGSDIECCSRLQFTGSNASLWFFARQESRRLW